jgi:uncharacterized protein
MEIQQNNITKWSLKILKLSIYFTVFSTIFLLQNLRYPEDLRFIARHLDRIDFGRKFYPEGSLIVIVLVLLIYLIFYKEKLLKYFSVKPLYSFKPFIWITGFFLLIFVIEHAQTGFEYIFQTNIHPFYLSEYAILFLIISIIAPLEEELVFRSPLIFLFGNKSRYVWLILSCFWFTLVHKDPIFAISFSLGLSVLTIKFKNLWVPIIAHLIWNLYGILVI